MLSTLVFGAFVQSTLGMLAEDHPPTEEPVEEPYDYDLLDEVETEDATSAPEPLADGYVFGTPDHDSCPQDYIPITHKTECQNAAQILGIGWLRANGIGVCTYIENSKHKNDNNKMYYGDIGSAENKEADHHTLVCKRADCGEIERNYNYKGADLLEVDDVASAEDCAALCADEVGCLSFAYEKSPKTCFLKSQLKHKRILDGRFDSGLPCAGSGPIDCVNLPEDWMDNDGDGCVAYGNGGWCGASWQSAGSYGLTADTACCECGGGDARRRMEADKTPLLRRLLQKDL